MSESRYVIVYRDGHYGVWRDKQASDEQLAFKSVPTPMLTPAYRIRCREKAIKSSPEIIGKGVSPINPDRLDPAKAYADAGLRK